jgi:hypothetical protein
MSLRCGEILLFPPDYRGHAPCWAFSPIRKKLRLPACGASCRKLDVPVINAGRYQLVPGDRPEVEVLGANLKGPELYGNFMPVVQELGAARAKGRRHGGKRICRIQPEPVLEVPDGLSCDVLDASAPSAMDIGNDAALRIDQENGLAIRDFYNETKAGHIGGKRVSGRRDKRRRALLQVPNGLFADEIYRIAMELAA